MIFTHRPSFIERHMASKINRSILVILLGALGILLFQPSHAVSAQQPKPTPSDNEVNRVAKQLYCPVCENIPLDVCPTQACAEWRELIRQKLVVGWSDQQIKDYFALQYGDRVLSEPPQKGLNWLVYFLPPIFFLGGAFILYTVLRKMRQPVKAAAAATAASAVNETQSRSDDPYLSQVEEELKKRN
jgi:cytochrome c-type biogenesis protein CcmH